ncbi:MAG: DUF5720 family protein [Oscillospiraceae bacterium]|nr:DUF5720 family protein [Oscillospiraceae bacterium]
MSIKSQLRQPGRRKQTSGHGITALEHYAPDTRHMGIINVVKDYAGHRSGWRVRQFLTDDGYNEVTTADGRGNVKIIRHALVRKGLFMNIPASARRESYIAAKQDAEARESFTGANR